MTKKAVVLLSAGLDSSVNLFKAVRELDVVLALTFDYGQRAAQKEIQAARKLTTNLGISHHVVELPFFKDFTKTSLVNNAVKVPVGDEVKMDDFEVSTATAERVWVPNRNGIFLNIAAAYAEGVGASYVIPGFNAEEAVTFPDNTPAYMKALDQSFAFSTANHVQVKCFTDGLVKTEIVQLGRELGVPFGNLWPCYHAGETLCGQCESCQRFDRALREANA